jgi:hypothetical protein
LPIGVQTAHSDAPLNIEPTGHKGAIGMGSFAGQTTLNPLQIARDHPAVAPALARDHSRQVGAGIMCLLFTSQSVHYCMY